MRSGVTPWVAPPRTRAVRLACRRPVQASSDTSSDKSTPGEEDAPVRSKANSARAKGGGDIRASRGKPPTASSVWRDPAAKAASTRRKAELRREGKSRDEADEMDKQSPSSSSMPSTKRNRNRHRRGEEHGSGIRRWPMDPNKSSGSGPQKDPFSHLPKGALDAEVEKELGQCVQELLRIEAMRNRLCEETIAEELRREPTDDVFSKDFGKKSAFRDPQKVDSNEDTSSIVFKKRLAEALGYRKSAQDDGVKLLEKNITRGQAARRAFVTHNVGIAASVASDMWGKITTQDRGLLTKSELTLDGCAGLARAADRFDPNRGYKFSTYCFFWVRKAVIDSVNECGRTIKLPKYLSGVLRESRKTHAELNTKLGRPPTDEELATASNVDVERVREWRRWNMLPLSLDQSPGSSKDLDGGETLGDVVSVDGGGGRQLQDGMDAMSPMAAAEADADADLLRLALDDALSTLLPRERFVLRHRFGLASASVKALETENDNGTKQPRLPGVTSHKEKQGKDGFMKGDYSIPEAEKVLSKEELGRGATGASVVLLGSLMGVSGETVRTIERRAIAKLKKPSRMGLVVSYVDKQTRHDIETASMGDEQFAQALALAVERADERAGGGRVFGAFAGGAVPVDAADGNAEDGQTLATQKKPQKRPRRRKKPVPKSKDVDAASSETPREAVTVTQTVLEI